MNPAWQQRKLMEFCNANGITIAAYSPLGGPGARWGSKGVLESEVLKEISVSKGKSVAQLTDEELKKIADIPQSRASLAKMFISETGLFKSLEQLWDGE
ncbi:hypothetical protein ACET3Z_030211 [Daucus carota]